MREEKSDEPDRAAVNPAMRHDPPRPHGAGEEEDPQAEPRVRGTQGATLNPLDAGGVAE